MSLDSLGSLLEFEEEKRGRALEYGIFALWILMFVFQGWSLQIYFSAKEYIDLQYLRTMLEIQNKILLLNIISNVLWFVVTVYILYSALFVERREAYNIASGVLFFVSGVAELLVAITMWGYYGKIDYLNKHMPLLGFDEVRKMLIDISEGMYLYMTISNIVVLTSIGLAFILIGLSIRKYADKLLGGIFTIQLGEVQHGPQIPQSEESPEEYKRALEMETYRLSIIRQIEAGARTLRSGGNIYMACGVMDLISVLIPSLSTLAFILFIIGVIKIGQGRKMIERVRKQLITTQQIGG